MTKTIIQKSEFYPQIVTLVIFLQEARVTHMISNRGEILRIFLPCCKPGACSETSCTDTVKKHLNNSPPCSEPSLKSPDSVVFSSCLSRSKNIYANPVALTRKTNKLKSKFPVKSTEKHLLRS